MKSKSTKREPKCFHCDCGKKLTRILPRSTQKKFTLEQLKVACRPVAFGVHQNNNHFFSHVMTDGQWFEISDETIQVAGTHAQMLQHLKQPKNESNKPYFVITEKTCLPPVRRKPELDVKNCTWNWHNHNVLSLQIAFIHTVMTNIICFQTSPQTWWLRWKIYYLRSGEGGEGVNIIEYGNRPNFIGIWN